MKRLIILVAYILITLAACGGVAHVAATPSHVTQAVTSTPVSVCDETGLTGPALQENKLYCAYNEMTGTTTNAAHSTYKQAIDLARKKHIIIGTPISVSQTVDWSGVPITYVEFSSGFHAEHFNPSRGIARIYDQYDRQVYP